MQDDLIKFNLNLARLDANTRAKVITLLESMQKDLLAELTSGKQLTEWGKARINKLLKESGIIIDDYYGRAQNTLQDVIDGVAPISATATQAALLAAVPVSVNVGLPTAGYLKEVVSNSLVEGATIKDWWDKQSADMRFKYAAQLRQGLAAGETNQQLIKRVTETIGQSKRNAAALVQTSVQTVANNARMATFEENEDIIKGYRFLSTLDSHTCPTCGALDGKRWDKNKKPINHSLDFRNPPRHFNCRCILVPVLLTFKEMGVDLPEPQAGKRASSIGPVSDKTTFADFLKRQPDSFVEEVLGKKRADMYLDGKLGLDDLINGNGKQLTLEQLRSKYS